jgi:hypothetical protein
MRVTHGRDVITYPLFDGNFAFGAVQGSTFSSVQSSMFKIGT